MGSMLFEKNGSPKCRCMSLPLNTKVQGGQRCILSGFPTQGRHTRSIFRNAFRLRRISRLRGIRPAGVHFRDVFNYSEIRGYRKWGK